MPEEPPAEPRLNSRLEAEINEILQKSGPLPEPVSLDEARRKRARAQRAVAQDARRARVKAAGGKVWSLAMRVPIVTAVVMAGLALVLRDVPVAPQVLAVAAVVFVFVPIVMHHRAPAPSPKMWRGRAIDDTPPSTAASNGPLQWLRRQLKLPEDR